MLDSSKFQKPREKPCIEYFFVLIVGNVPVLNSLFILYFFIIIFCVTVEFSFVRFAFTTIFLILEEMMSVEA